MKRMYYWLLCVVGLFVAMLVVGCPNPNTPPNVEAVSKQFTKNYRDIEIIVNFMKSTNYTDIYISDTSGTMLTDLVQVSINDECVVSALKNTLGVEGGFLKVNKYGNTIWFLTWKGLQDIGCGISYTINETDIPDIPYCTELVPLSKTGWYYFVVDYNTWRSTGGHKTGDGSLS